MILIKVTVKILDCEQIEKGNKALLDVKSRSVDGLANLKKGRQTNVEIKSNAESVLQEMKDDMKEVNAWLNLLNQENTSVTVGSLERVIKFCDQYLALAKECGNLKEEGTAYNILGIANHRLGYQEKAIEYFKRHHANRKNLGEKAGEICACQNLASAFQVACNITKAIEYYKECLNTCIDVGDTIGEEEACTNLGNAFNSLYEYKVALEYYQRSLVICKGLGDKRREGTANSHIGLMYWRLMDSKKATEHLNISLEIFKELVDQSGQATVCHILGVVCCSVGEFKQAKEYLMKCINIAKTFDDGGKEGHAWGMLGEVHYGEGNFMEAIKCLNLSLDFVRKVGDRNGEGALHGNLGKACLGVGDVKGAMEHFQISLAISKEVGDKDVEANAYNNLGNAHSILGNYRLATQYQNQSLTIWKELKNRRMEGKVYLNLGVQSFYLGNLKQAIEIYGESLLISKEVRDKDTEACALGNLGNAYVTLCEYKKADEYLYSSLIACKEKGNRAYEGTIYGNLGCVYSSVGDFKKSIKYHNQHLAISKEVGDRAGEGRVYGNLSMVYNCLGKYKEAVNYHKQHLSIFKELGHKAEETMALRNIGSIQEHLGDLEQAKEYYDRHLEFSKETGHRTGEGDACLRLSFLLLSLGEVQQAMEISKQHLIICKETGDICGEGSAYLCQGHCLQDLGFLSDAAVSYQSSVQRFNHVRSLLHSMDEWKISLRNEYRMAYMELWNVLLKLNRIGEALLAAEKGRAQALVDLLVSQYRFGVHQHGQVSQEETSSELLACASLNTAFLALYENDINVWLLQDGENVQFGKQNVDTGALKLNAGGDLDSFVKKAYKEIGVRSSVKCEDRSLDALDNKDDLLTVQEPDLLLLSTSLPKMRVDNNAEPRTPPIVHNKCLSVLYNVIVAPVIQHLRGNELVIVPDGPLFLVPFAALQDAESRYLCESFRIRVVPSLTCLKMIMDAPPDYHCKSGALIVGDPWVQDVVDILGKPKLVQLSGARKEAEMIGEIVKSSPLTGSDATKEDVLKRLNSVALIHLAAHGRIETGEIALAPNTLRKSPNPRKEDFLLTMSDVLSVGLRARLVVLSCCHSGRGEIKDEGVVGIARAFLGAGARSVLVSLWALEDVATLEFMRVFYERLVEGKKASEALNCATNYMRESKEFGKIRQWAPFVLIGDDVTLECFQGK